MGGCCQHQGGMSCSFFSPLLFAAGWWLTSKQKCFFTLHQITEWGGEGRWNWWMQNKADKQRKTEKPVEIQRDCQENQACYWHGRVKFGNRGGESQKSARGNNACSRLSRHWQWWFPYRGDGKQKGAWLTIGLPGSQEDGPVSLQQHGFEEKSRCLRRKVADKCKEWPDRNKCPAICFKILAGGLTCNQGTPYCIMGSHKAPGAKPTLPHSVLLAFSVSDSILPGALECSPSAGLGKFGL